MKHALRNIRFLTLRLMVAYMSVFVFSFTVFSQSHVTTEEDNGYHVIKLETIEMPKLNIARAGHATFCIDGELVVLGGHTDGFVPTPTIEYFKDGKWHTMPMAYTHDQGVALQLRSGKVFIAGGHKEELGIGQIFSAEIYDPKTHITKGFGCMDRKRAFATALEMDDGQVLISGNWFADDGIEVFENVYDRKLTNAVKNKDVYQPRTTPYILRISDDDAIIFSSLDNRCNPTESVKIDRLKGDAYEEPFLEKWRPIRTIAVQRSTNHFIGDEATGRYEWLLPVENDSTNQVAIAKVTGTQEAGGKPVFAFLPTQQPLPQVIDGKTIVYSSLVCDRDRGLAYLLGHDDDFRIYVVSFEYGSLKPSPLNIYVTEPQPFQANCNTPVLMSNGDLVYVGGSQNNNFNPTDAVIKLPLGGGDDTKATLAGFNHSGNVAKGFNPWLWICIVILFGISAFAVYFVSTRKKDARMPLSDALGVNDDDTEPQSDKNPQKEEALVDIFKRIEQLMVDDRLYLNANLRATDIATRLRSNTAYISAAINSQRGCSFTQYLTNYRIDYAKELMRRNPEEKISAISLHSGFSTESTFFRAFRATTGMSPKEWMTQYRDNVDA